VLSAQRLPSTPAPATSEKEAETLLLLPGQLRSSRPELTPAPLKPENHTSMGKVSAFFYSVAPLIKCDLRPRPTESQVCYDDPIKPQVTKSLGKRSTV
jgi:hypothetical protein